MFLQQHNQNVLMMLLLFAERFHNAVIKHYMYNIHGTSLLSRIQAMNFWSLSTRGHSHITGLSHSYRSPF